MWVFDRLPGPVLFSPHKANGPGERPFASASTTSTTSRASTVEPPLSPASPPRLVHRPPIDALESERVAQ
jgi:hypothetical protein